MEPALYGLAPGTTQNADPTSAYPIAGQYGAAQGIGTGQHGIAPVPTLGGNMIGNALQTVWQWLNTPFQTPMSPVNVMLLVGVVLISIIIWNLFLYHVRIAAETI